MSQTATINKKFLLLCSILLPGERESSLPLSVFSTLHSTRYQLKVEQLSTLSPSRALICFHRARERRERDTISLGTYFISLPSLASWLLLDCMSLL